MKDPLYLPYFLYCEEVTDFSVSKASSASGSIRFLQLLLLDASPRKEPVCCSFLFLTLVLTNIRTNMDAIPLCLHGLEVYDWTRLWISFVFFLRNSCGFAATLRIGIVRFETCTDVKCGNGGILE